MVERNDFDLITTWYGTFLCRDGAVLERYLVPTAREAIAERMTLRREGRVTLEEKAACAAHPGATVRSPDRRLEPLGVRVARVRWPELSAEALGFDTAAYHDLLLEKAIEDLDRSWDPALPLPEAFRALQDLESMANLLEERLEEWMATDRDPETSETPERRPGALALTASRENVRALVTAADSAHRALETALDAATEEKAPNLTSLLGPRLAAQLIAHAGGLERLARLPASTIQVLGAEKAFFEHLRRRAPPPRHGLLFLHPSIHGAPRSLRGKLARALAGKAAIAARLDREGTALRPDLKEAFEKRAAEVRQRAPPRRARGGRAEPDRGNSTSVR
jgi:nucleolar protein 56